MCAVNFRWIERKLLEIVVCCEGVIFSLIVSYSKYNTGIKLERGVDMTYTWMVVECVL